MSSLRQSTRRLDAVVLFVCWMAAVAWLLFGDRYQVFLRPGFGFLLSLAFCILVMFLMVTLFGPHVRRHIPEGSVRWTRFALLILPLLYLIEAQDVTLGSYAFRNRSTAVTVLDKMQAGRALEEIGRDNDLTLLEILQYYKEFEGKSIVTEGMVYKGEDVPDQHFLVFRFLMVCCAADALPAGALVAYQNPEEFENDSWVRVEGVLSLKSIGDLSLPHIQAERITLIDRPRFPYLIPSFT